MPFDLHPQHSSTLSDLSKSYFENEYLPQAFAADVLETNDRTYEQRLAACKMLVSTQDLTPTVCGLLTLAKAPQEFIPGAYIQFLRINGTSLTDPVIDEDKITGTVGDILRRVDEKLKSHNRVAIDATSAATQIEEPVYPMAALRQIVYNAVLHRTYEKTNAPIRVYWYNDRIEITSPGGPYGNVTEENFAKPGVTDYRNPNLCDVLKTLGYVQAFGSGIGIAGKALRDSGHPEPHFVVNSSIVQCAIPKKTPKKII